MASILNATTTSGLVTSADNSGSLQLQTNNGTTAVTIDTSQTTTINSPSSTPLIVQSASTERMRIDSSGNVGIGTSSPGAKLQVAGGDILVSTVGNKVNFATTGSSTVNYVGGAADGFSLELACQRGASQPYVYKLDYANGHIWSTAGSERMRIDSSGNLMVATTNTTPATSNVVGYSVNSNGIIYNTVDSNPCVYINRKTNDGELVRFYQDGTQEGNISVSGSTVSYNGGHLSRYAQTLTPKDDSLLKGTVLSNLDEMNEYVNAEGNPVANEQLNKVKVSDVEGDVNVAGVFVNWSHDEQHNVDEINMAMTGDMIIRIAEGVVVQKGDLLMSAGNGTAKPQGDDIVRSKTVAKVTSNHVTCTYADGSYCVPCVLMAC